MLASKDAEKSFSEESCVIQSNPIFPKHVDLRWKNPLSPNTTTIHGNTLICMHTLYTHSCTPPPVEAWPQINPFSQERASKVRFWEPGRSEVTVSEHSKLVTHMGALASYPWTGDCAFNWTGNTSEVDSSLGAVWSWVSAAPLPFQWVSTSLLQPRGGGFLRSELTQTGRVAELVAGGRGWPAPWGWGTLFTPLMDTLRIRWHVWSWTVWNRGAE